MTFEERLARLEAIAAELERDELGLAQALELFDEGIEHLLVEAGGVGERGVAALDRGGEPRAQCDVLGEMLREVRKAERDVPQIGRASCRERV